MADKYQSTLGWEFVSQTEYALIASYVYNAGNTVTYYNSVTGFNFVGFATVAEDEFIRGDQFLKNLNVTILEV